MIVLSDLNITHFNNNDVQYQQVVIHFIHIVNIKQVYMVLNLKKSSRFSSNRYILHFAKIYANPFL